MIVSRIRSLATLAAAAWFALPAPPPQLWAELIETGLLRPDAPVPA